MFALVCNVKLRYFARMAQDLYFYSHEGKKYSFDKIILYNIWNYGRNLQGG